MPLRVIESVDSRLVLGLDMGRVFGPSDIALTGRNLAGLAVGLRGRTGAVNFDVSWAKPLLAPAGFKTKANVIYASVTYAF
jgi:hemolysin activation/secretion protein